MPTIGERIKNARIISKLTQNDLGKAVGVSGVAIMRYEKGLRTPNIKTLEDLSKVLNVSVGYLLGLEYIPQTGGDAEANRSSPYKLIREQQRQKDLQKLNSAFDKLNDDGQQKAVERVEELTEIPKYRREK